MAKYIVQLSRVVRDYRVVTVEANSPEAARRRALALSRDAVEPREGEDVPDWCDGDARSSRPTVHFVERC